ncbi:hypothetical protein LB505_009850 [Fusarium chuoi]|nr:hypothetical protein LB505_009850 [Fusarium chuoi]
MWQNNSQNKDTKRTADVACHSCRKRKARFSAEEEDTEIDANPSPRTGRTEVTSLHPPLIRTGEKGL